LDEVGQRDVAVFRFLFVAVNHPRLELFERAWTIRLGYGGRLPPS
jgi:hypothetical protein